MKCCICNQEIDGYGNNPNGAVWRDGSKIVEPQFNENERCCDACDQLFVTPGRLYRLMKMKGVKSNA